MENNTVKNKIITAGANYLDIDAYACCVALAELLKAKGENAAAYSDAPCNYSVCKSLADETVIVKELPSYITEENAEYIIVDVSDPDFLKASVPIDKITAVYDHHAGFEEYWKRRIGDFAQIEFIGAAATLIYREWKKAGLQGRMSRRSALLLIAAILDNTLYLTSSNTTAEDIESFNELCSKENITQEWCSAYFSEVQKSVEADLKNALFKDIKTVSNNAVLPPKIAQLCVWDANSILLKLPEIRQIFAEITDGWMLNVIDIRNRCSYFVCDNTHYRGKIEKVFGIRFISGVAKTPVSYLRKEIIRKTLLYS